MYGIFGPLTDYSGNYDLNKETADLTLYASTECGTFGKIMALADLDGDGCDDLILGDPGAQPGTQPVAGEVTVLFGRADAPAAWTVDWTATGPDLALRLDVVSVSVGLAVATGDWDGDGNTDLAFSLYPPSRSGAVALLRGPLAHTAGAVRDLAANPPDLTILGPGVAGDGFGSSLTFRDIDGDGRDDLAIGAETFFSGDNGGAAFVLYGRDFAAAPETWDLATDAPEVAVYSGPGAFRGFGRRVQLADLSGDGEADLVVSDPFLTLGINSPGALFRIDHDRLARGTEIVLADDAPDLSLIGLESWWYFFDAFTVIDTLAGAPILVAAANYGTYGEWSSGGIVYRLDRQQLAGELVKLSDIDPTALYYGDGVGYLFGESLAVASLDGNGTLDLVAGGDGGEAGDDGGAVAVFFDQFAPVPVDDDAVDDDASDDDTADDDADDDVVDDDLADDDQSDDDQTDDDADDDAADDDTDDDQTDDNAGDDDDDNAGCGC